MMKGIEYRMNERRKGVSLGYFFGLLTFHWSRYGFTCGLRGWHPDAQNRQSPRAVRSLSPQIPKGL